MKTIDLLAILAFCTLCLFCGFCMGYAARIYTEPKQTKSEKVPCFGYTKIEYGVGVNCDGDTVRVSEWHDEWSKLKLKE